MRKYVRCILYFVSEANSGNNKRWERKPLIHKRYECCLRDMSAVSLLSTSNWMKSWKHYRRSLILISSIYICFIGKFHWFFHLLLIKNLKCINCYTYFSTMTASLIMKFKKKTKNFYYKHCTVMRQRKVFDVDEYEMIMMNISKVE